MSAEPRNRLSVDLGTLSTSAALVQSDGTSRPVDLGEHAASMPSTVAVADGRVVVGAAADAVLAEHPERAARDLQRRFGDTTPIVLDGRPFTADALATEVLTSVAAAAGVDPADTTLVLTHPASWHQYKCDLLATAGAAAGFGAVEVISEAEAAVQPYVRSGRLSAGDTVVVYDFGGTFEASLVTVSDRGVNLLGSPQTLDRLGGDVLDQLVFRHVTDALGGTLQALDRSDPTVRTAIGRLRAECTAAKERLSVDGETSVPVVAPGLDTRVRMTRDEFETAVRPHITETLQALDRLLASAGLQAAEVTATVLVGGGTRVPLVAEMVAGHIGRPALAEHDPNSVVAVGAVSAIAAIAALIAAPAAAAAAAASDQPSTTSTQRETAMSDQPTTEGAAPAADTPAAAAGAAGSGAGGAAGKAIPTPPPPPAKKVSSKAAGIAGGVAAAAAAVAAGVVFGDDVVSAFEGNPDGGAMPGGIDGPETRTADRIDREAGDQTDTAAPADAAAPATADDSMDVFDAVATTGVGGAAQGAAVGSPLAPPAPQQPTFDRPAPQAATQRRPQFEADDGPAAAPHHAAAAATAAAADAAAADAAAAASGGDADFEAARAQLLARLDNFTPPPGTSPEDAATLQQDLRDAVERFEPRDGQTTQDALAELRDDFDQRVQDFTQDQKIDALVAEAARDNADPATPTADAPPDLVPPVAGDATDTAADDGSTVQNPPVGDANNDGLPDEPAAVQDPDVQDPPVGDSDTDVNGDTDTDVNGDTDTDTDGDVDSDVAASTDGTPTDEGADSEGPITDTRFEVRPDLQELDLDPVVTQVPDDGPPPDQGGDDAGPGRLGGLDDGFDDLIQTDVRNVPLDGDALADPNVVADLTPVTDPNVVIEPGIDSGAMADLDGAPDAARGFAPGPEATAIDPDAVIQVRATVMPDTDRPVMMSDLGDDTYDQVKAAAEVPDDAPAPLTIDASALTEVVSPIAPEPEPPEFQVAPLEEPVLVEVQQVELDLPPVQFPDDDAPDEDPGFADDLHSDITPNSPTNMDFGTGA